MFSSVSTIAETLRLDSGWANCGAIERIQSQQQDTDIHERNLFIQCHRVLIAALPEVRQIQ